MGVVRAGQRPPNLETERGMRPGEASRGSDIETRGSGIKTTSLRSEGGWERGGQAGNRIPGRRISRRFTMTAWSEKGGRDKAGKVGRLQFQDFLHLARAFVMEGLKMHGGRKVA
jgi:hypothetical protein